MAKETNPSSSSLPFLPHGLVSFELKDLPGAYYVRDFFTKEQQELIQKQVSSSVAVSPSLLLLLLHHHLLIKSVQHRGSRRGTITSVTVNRSKGPFVAPFLPRRSLHQQPEFIQLITKKLTSSFSTPPSALREGEDLPLFIKAPMQISVNVYEDPDYWIVVRLPFTSTHTITQFHSPSLLSLSSYTLSLPFAIHLPFFPTSSASQRW
jgi:hypothetical protein